MKRIITICAAIALCLSACAQKSNLRQIENITYGIQDLNSLPQEKWDEIRQLVLQATDNAETAENYKTWEWLIRIYENDRAKMLTEYTTNGNKFTDMKAFFENEMNIVDACEKYFKLIQTPNDKGLLPINDKELEQLKAWVQSNAKASRSNLYVGATQFVYNEPAIALKLIESYYQSFNSPLYADMNLKSTDKYYKEAPYVYATVLKAVNGDKKKIEALLKEALKSSNGALACQELITLYDEQGDTANKDKYLNYAFENFPQTNVFGITLAQAAITNDDFAKTIDICNILIQRQKDGITPITDEAGNELENIWMPHYLKAIALFYMGQQDQAYEVFVEGDKTYPNHIELVVGAGMAATKFGNEHFSDKEVCTPWYEKAVKYLSKAEQIWPEQSDLWGNLLYVCYHNLGNKAMEEKYSKYAE